MAVDYLFTIDNPNDESRDVIFAFGIEARHLSRLAAQQHAVVGATPDRNSFNNAGDCVRCQLSGRDVIEKEERPRALDQNVVGAVIHEIASDGVVNASRERDLQFRTDAVRRCDERWLPHFGKRAVEHAAEAADFRERARVESGARKFLNLFGCAIRGIDVDAGISVSCGFRHRLE